MKHLKFIPALFLFLSLLACEPPVTFNEPQPANTKNLSKFPKHLQGEFLSLADSSTLIISDKLIQRIYDFDQKFHPSQRDSTHRLSGDSLTDLNTNEKKFVKRDGDSLVQHIHFTDTLFHLHDDNVVRKFKGYYFINTRHENTGWEVRKLQLSEGKLMISRISSETDIENLKEITESPQDTVAPYQFTPTKKQFKEFIRNDGFSDTETFIKMKKKRL